MIKANLCGTEIEIWCFADYCDEGIVLDIQNKYHDLTIEQAELLISELRVAIDKLKS